ncbi:MAG: 30S ribosomal protein S15 [Candidatus Magasanikbacteria bacterium GW2011_GWC2_40_17]|uniref:Small ribosomal subunit protein uS15 n=1 Tax=Candidatus Magasanikbacteria bacterium GW2011_GWA2_42_32 TaxID=1619039 RepID=A0A0G1CEX0_9BACT|nr:MAG: 30S ribosomal protein S15 [Candidatus Magasanikbacteria bacterium GW2011_GWC2_40_17]KKS57101.1 MAG: 30S ribosomal protein S15 [Candidatus Magasanikbacteria bacterium GW2011_GWA2_42_32]OGH85376.1 MAG: 30S ribosomal protein S15 [Candidatus Magasanikbacteria bacterium RIFOXYB2_FULL_38_10]
MLDKKAKLRIIEKYKTHENDTGSTEVQIAILTEEIAELSKHLKDHRKDNSSRRGLLRKVNERRRLLKYLSRENPKSYNEIIVKLKLKKAAVEEKPIEEDIEIPAAETAK